MSGDLGDGPFCPETPGGLAGPRHGRLYIMESGNLWCPVTQTLYGRGPDPYTVGPKLMQGGKMVPNVIMSPAKRSGKSAIIAEMRKLSGH